MYMKRMFLFLVLLLTFSAGVLFSQNEKEFVSIAFYNVENLFDTINEPGVKDEDFTPEGSYKWNTERYYEKLERISTVIKRMAEDQNGGYPAIIGLCEIENLAVLEDLVKHPIIAQQEYGIVHYDCEYNRGMDVALLYLKKRFTPTASVSSVLILENDSAYRTRDILVVSGELDGERMHFLVNHWPSRRGGEQRSAPLRNAAADLCRKHVDSLFAIEPTAKIIVMGDFNDDPINASMLTHLKSTGKIEEAKDGILYNAMFKLFRKGIGTLAYNDRWNLFDQMLLSPALVSTETKGYQFDKANVFNKPFLMQPDGRFAGYPFRTYVGSNYHGGYSDHFPVYVTLIR